MRPITVSAGPLAAADPDGIALSQQPASVFALLGALVVDGVARLGAPRRVLFTTTANETGVTFTVSGTNLAGAALSETLPGVDNTTTYTNLDFYTVTRVTVNGTLSGNVTVGTNGIGGSPWVFLDPWALPNTALQLTVDGTIDYTVETTLDDPNSPTNPVAAEDMAWVPSNDPGVVGATTTRQSNLFFVPAYVRAKINSGSGSVTMTVIQSGAVPQ